MKQKLTLQLRNLGLTEVFIFGINHSPINPMKKYLIKCLSILVAVGSLLLIPQAQATTLTAAQVAQTAWGVGFHGGALVNAVAIADAESGFVLEATHVNTGGSTDYGLWQINTYYHPEYNASQLLSSASYNATAAYNISGAASDASWTQWTTFLNGAFVSYLTVARNAAQNIDSTVIRGLNDQVSATISINVRPSAGSTSTTRAVSAGTTGTVIGGPVVSVIGTGSYRFIWWQIHWNDGGTDGWSVEDYMSRTSALSPSMSLNYSGTAIPNGDQSPSAAKGTDFGTTSSGLTVGPRTFTISNTGNGALNLTGMPRVQFGGNYPQDFGMTAQPSTPVPANGGSTTFQLVFQPTANTGLRSATVTIANDDPTKNPYTFMVQGTAQIQQRIDPSLEYSGTTIPYGDQSPTVSKGTDFGSVNVGSQSSTHSFQLYNYGNINMTLTGSFVQLSGANSSDFAIVTMPASPIAPYPNPSSTIGIRFQPTGPGLRTASVLIYYDDTYALGATSPYTVALQGAGTATLGSLQVTLAPAGAVSAGAQWQVDGGAWQSSGATVSGLSTGGHTLAFNTVSGWTTPGNQTPTIIANQTTAVTGTYAAQPGSLQVTLAPAGAVSAGAQWQVDGGAWQSSGATVSGLSAGGHTLAFKTVSGWTTPGNQTPTIIANQTTTATGTYGGQPGSLQVTLAPAGAVSAGAQWQVDGGAWQSSGATVSGLPAGGHTLAFSTVSGWTTPGSQTPIIIANQTTIATGTYVANPTPSITSPLPGSTLTSSSATFQWSSGVGVTNYFLYVGSSAGANDIFGQSVGLSLSTSVSNLPVNGSTLYVRLWWAIAGVWQYSDYTYTAPTGGATNVVFSDNFNDNAIDASKWTTSGSTVTEASQIMQVLTTVEDQGGVLASVPVPINAQGDITITRRALLHYANQYFAAQMNVKFGDLGWAGVRYANYIYAGNPSYGWENRYGIYLSRYGVGFINQSSDTNLAGPFSPIWDTWFTEKLVYTPDTGNLQYFTNDVKVADFFIGVMPATNTPTIQFQFTAWGWYTGHQQLFDDFLVTQAAVAAPQVQLTGMSISNRVFRFVLNGPVGSNYVVKVSTNLVNWSPLSTNTVSAGGWVIVTDPGTTNMPRRFYRAVAP